MLVTNQGKRHRGWAMGSGLAAVQHGGCPRSMPSYLCCFFVFPSSCPLPLPLISPLSPPSPSTQCPQALSSPAAQPGDNQPGMGPSGTPQWDPDWIFSQIRGLYVLSCFFLDNLGIRTPFSSLFQRNRSRKLVVQRAAWRDGGAGEKFP